jgi:hypothetical protein
MTRLIIDPIKKTASTSFTKLNGCRKGENEPKDERIEIRKGRGNPEGNNLLLFEP